MFDCTFFEHWYCIIWPLINENKQKLDKKEKTQNYVILVFFRKKFISKDMKTINYKIKKLNRFVYSSNGNPRDLQLTRTCLKSTKKNVKYNKNQKLIYFFLWKTRVEASKLITNSFKTLDFVTPIFFDSFFGQNYFHLYFLINETS